VTTTPPPVAQATPEDVAALLRARTKDSNGDELGAWTDDTRPTRDEVQALIDQARGLVSARTGPTIPSPCQGGYEALVALQAAALVELSYFPEQVPPEQSPYTHLRELVNDQTQGVLDCIAGNAGADGGTGGVYDLDVSGDWTWGWPADWFQRNLDRPLGPDGPTLEGPA